MVLARWQGTVVDDAGNVQDGASVTVRLEIIGTPLASLFSDRDGLVATGNPITADADGAVGFHVIGGAYQITATKGSFSRTWRYVGIGTASEHDDNSDVPFAGINLAAETSIIWGTNDVLITHQLSGSPEVSSLVFTGAPGGYIFDAAINGTSLSDDVQSTGLNGVDGDQFFIYKQYTTALGGADHPSSEISVLRAQRNANYTGGTPGNVENTIWARHDVAAGVANFEWSILAQLDNFATGGENVAIYGQATKESGAGPTWAGTYDIKDKNANPSTGVIGVEIGVFANGGDSNSARIGLDVVGGKDNTGGTTPTITFGIRVGPQNGIAANATFTNGLLLTKNFGVGINLSDADCSTADIITKGSVGFGTSTPDRRLHSEVADAVTAATTQALRLTHTTSGTAAADFGVGLEAELENASGTNIIAGSLEWAFTDPVNATEDANLLVKLIGGGASATIARFAPTGRLGLGPAAPNPAVNLDIRDTGDTQVRTFSNGIVDMRMLASSASAVGFIGTFTNHPIIAQINGVEALRITTNRLPIWSPASATPETLATNGQITMTLTSNTNLRFSARGSDGTTRVANLTLA